MAAKPAQITEVPPISTHCICAIDNRARLPRAQTRPASAVLIAWKSIPEFGATPCNVRSPPKNTRKDPDTRQIH